jgi:hypothetical protein
VRAQTRGHLVDVTVREHLVVLERVEDRGVVCCRDHSVEHAQDVVLHRMRFVDVFDQLVLESLGHLHPPQCELTELAAEHGRASVKAAVLRLQLVHEHPERRAIVKLATAHLERHTRKVRELGRALRAVDAFHAPVQGWQRAGNALH